MDSFHAVIALWPSQRAFADAVGAKHENARKWAQRNSIPPEWWARVVTASTELAEPITLERLQAIKAASPRFRKAA